MGSTNRVVLVSVLLLLAVSVSAFPLRLKANKAGAQQWRADQEASADLEALAYEAGIEFAEPSSATVPHPPPTPGHAAPTGNAAASESMPVVTGMGKELRFKMGSVQQMISLVAHAKKVGMNVAQAEHVLMKVRPPTVFNRQGLDARQQLQAGKRANLISSVKKTCSAAWDKISMKASLALSVNGEIGGDSKALASFGASAKLVLKAVGTLSIECSDAKVCSKCLWEAMMLVVVPGYGMFASAGADTFETPKACEPTLFGWCTSFVHRWLCDQEVLEGVAQEDVSTQNSINSFSACDAETAGGTGSGEAALKRKCEDFERFLRPLRPDFMRFMKCDMTRGWTKGWRKFGEFGRDVTSRLTSALPPLQSWALHKIDQRHSRNAAASTFSCPPTAHDQAHQVCAYFLPILEIPELEMCQADPKASDEKEMQKAVNKKALSEDNPSSLPKIGKDGGKLDSLYNGAGCVMDAFDYARKQIAADPLAKGAVTATSAGNFLTGYTQKKACKSIDAIMAKIPDQRLISWLGSGCQAPLSSQKISICESQAVVCAAVVKANLLNNYWKVTNLKSQHKVIGIEVTNPFANQKISVTEMCESVAAYAPGVAHRCKRFKEMNREQLPYLMLAAGCSLPSHSVEVQTEQGTQREDVICSAPSNDQVHEIMENAFKACVESRHDLSLPVLHQCPDTEMPDGLVMPWSFSLQSSLSKLADINKHYVENSLFYRVLSDGGASEWTRKEIYPKVAAALKWDSVTDEKAMCEWVTTQVLNNNVNHPCEEEPIDKSKPTEVSRQKLCTAVRQNLWDMTTESQSLSKITNSLNDIVMPFLVKSRAAVGWGTAPDNLCKFSDAPKYLCNQLVEYAAAKNKGKKQKDQMPALDAYGGHKFAAATSKAELPECKFCNEYLTRRASSDKSSPGRSDALEYFVYQRYRFVWDVLSTNLKVKKSWKTVDAALAADDLSAVPFTAIAAALTDKHTFTADTVTKASARSPLDSSQLASDFKTAITGKGKDVAKRIEAYCGLMMPQCFKYAALP